MQGRGHLEVDVWVIDECVVDLLQTGRTLGRARNAERHAHRLIFLNVGVLTHNHDFQILELGLSKRVEDKLFRRVARALFILTLHKAEESAEGSRLQVGCEGLLPVTERGLEIVEGGKRVLPIGKSQSLTSFLGFFEV